MDSAQAIYIVVEVSETGRLDASPFPDLRSAQIYADYQRSTTTVPRIELFCTLLAVSADECRINPRTSFGLVYHGKAGEVPPVKKTKK